MKWPKRKGPALREQRHGPGYSGKRSGFNHITRRTRRPYRPHQNAVWRKRGRYG